MFCSYAVEMLSTANGQNIISKSYYFLNIIALHIRNILFILLYSGFTVELWTLLGCLERIANLTIEDSTRKIKN